MSSQPKSEYLTNLNREQLENEAMRQHRAVIRRHDQIAALQNRLSNFRGALSWIADHSSDPTIVKRARQELESDALIT